MPFQGIVPVGPRAAECRLCRMLQEDGDAVAEVHPGGEGVGGGPLRGDVAVRVEQVRVAPGRRRVMQDSGAVGSGHGQCPVGVQAEGEAVLVDDGVVAAAQQYEIGQVA